MGLTTYLAMTAAEIHTALDLPEHIVWMACHFSSYATGLSNCPTSLPPGSLLMVNDRTPIWHHDPAHILMQLQHMEKELQPDGIILDFQRPDCWETEQLTGILVKELTCPVAVSEHYSADFDCPVFLSAPPLCVSLEEHLKKWSGRKIWLEAVLSAEILTLTSDGCTRLEDIYSQSAVFDYDAPELFCSYRFTVSEEKAVFTLQRSKEDLRRLLEAAKVLGVERAIGFYQQLH